jgi:hypothetical protein
MSLVDQKCRAWLVDQGYRVEKVERWNNFTKRKNDLFGIIDYLAVGHGQTVAVQATNSTTDTGGGNFAARVTKVKQSDALQDLLDAGWIVQVVGFKKGQRAPDRIETL